MKLFFYDLETTGLDSRRNAIHQISGEINIDGVTVEKFNFHVKPFDGAEINPKALEVAGVTEAQITAYPDKRTVYNELVKLLGKYVDKYNRNDKLFLIGYNNVHFDNEFFREFFRICGDNYFGSWFWANSIDVMVLASLHLAEVRGQMPDFKLATVAKCLGIDVNAEDLHDAYYDIYLTKEVFNKVTGGKQ